MFGKLKSQYNYLIVGLGNPGLSYANTRHNAGFFAVDFMAEKFRAQWKTKANSFYGEVSLGDSRCLLQKPQTFMNNSGEAVGSLCRYFKIVPQKVILIHDDITLLPGKFKIKNGGSCGGHNGLSSVEDHLGTQDYIHIKVGIGSKPHPEMSLADFVLGIIPATDRQSIIGRLPDICDAVFMICNGDIEKAKAKYN